MTLEEAINLYERQTEEMYKAIPCDGCAFDKCKEEKEQLIEWLKELKKYREMLKNEPQIREEVQMYMIREVENDT